MSSDGPPGPQTIPRRANRR